MSTATHEMVFQPLINALKKGRVPWTISQDQHSTLRNRLYFPVRFKGEQYSFINTILIWTSLVFTGHSDSAIWLTEKQAEKCGGRLKEYDKHVNLLLWPVHRNNTTSSPTGWVPYRAYNASNFEGLPKLKAISTDTRPPHECESLAGQLISQSSATVIPGNNRAYYQNQMDVIRVPSEDTFLTRGEYFVDVLLQLMRWSGHRSRLDWSTNELLKHYEYASLAASLGSAYLATFCGLPARFCIDHLCFLPAWATLIERTPDRFLELVRLTQHAVDFVINPVPVRPLPPARAHRWQPHSEYFPPVE